MCGGGGSDYGDVREWMQECEAGKVYEKLVVLSGWTREEVKRGFLPLLFDRWERTQMYPLFGVFAQNYPQSPATSNRQKVSVIKSLRGDASEWNRRCVLTGYAVG